MAVAALGLIATVQRLDGRSAPMSALPTDDATTAPEISFQEAGGEMHKLSDYHGKVVLVNFWQRGACPAASEMPMLSAAQSEFGRTASW